MNDTPLRTATLVSGLYFGECPRWHQGRLWYSDFFAHAICSTSPEGEARVELAFDGEPGGLGWLPDGRLLFVSRLERALFRREHDGSVVRHGELTPWATFHANDMVVASNGQAYAGNFGFDLDAVTDGDLEPGAVRGASLVRVDPDGTSSEAAADLGFPNGAVITEDGRTLVLAESMRGRLSAFDRAADGTLSQHRVWAALEGVAPDGICLCADGSIWVANAMTNECVRVAEGGQVLERVTTEQRCFACMLGDDDRRTLYVMTAPESHAARAAAAPHGTIERVRTTVPGAGLP